MRQNSTSFGATWKSWGAGVMNARGDVGMARRRPPHLGLASSNHASCSVRRGDEAGMLPLAADLEQGSEPGMDSQVHLPVNSRLISCGTSRSGSCMLEDRKRVPYRPYILCRCRVECTQLFSFAPRTSLLEPASSTRHNMCALEDAVAKPNASQAVINSVSVLLQIGAGATVLQSKH